MFSVQYVCFVRPLLISTPSLRVYYFFVVDSVCLSVCLFVTLLLQVDSTFCFSTE